VSSLDRYLLGSYGLRYNRDRSRVNISSPQCDSHEKLELQ
jgi:hypothetical protein